MYLIIIFECDIVVGFSNIRVTEYKFVKVASVIREVVLPKEDLAAINVNGKKSWKGREVDDRGSMS